MNRVQPDTRVPQTPAVYIYLVNVTQTGTSAPTVKVIQNNGNLTVTKARIGAGNYRFTFTDWAEEEIDFSKCAAVFIQNTLPLSSVTTDVYGNIVNIKTNNGGYVDDVLTDNTLEVRIYRNKIVPLI